MFKKFLALFLALALVAPSFAVREAQALTESNYTLEPYTFTQRGTVLGDKTGSLPSSYGLSDKTPVTYSLNDNASWVYAAIAALETAAVKSDAATKTFNSSDMASALSKSVNNTTGFTTNVGDAGNRAMVTAYLMRGTYGGPVSGMSGAIGQGTTINLLQKSKPEQPVSGIVYIPDLSVTADVSAKNIYRERIKNAIVNYGAVAASLYFDNNNFYEQVTREDPIEYDSSTRLYHNTTRRSADHTVVILGWDDSKSIIYTYNVTTGTGDNQVTSARFETVTGAFLVRDSRNLTGEAYWVSYDTILSGAYFIEGYYNASDFPLVTQPGSGTKNPLEGTYEYDSFGLTAAQGFNSSTAWFANVFTVSSSPEALRAVSVFLTGENNSFEIYYVADYTDTDSLKNGVLIASGTRSLPGYYTVPVETADGDKYVYLPNNGKKFAIYAKVTQDGTSPIPVQSTKLAAAASGRGFISNNGDTWTDVYGQGQASICLKAHTEKNVEILLESVSLAQSVEDDMKQYTSDDKALLKAAPGLSYTIGPMLEPANATDVILTETKWTANMEYAERDAEGYLVVDANGDPVVKTGELVWNETWGMFTEESYLEVSKPSAFNKKAVTEEDGAEKYETVENYVEPAISLVSASNGSYTLKASKAEENFGKTITLEVEVNTGTKNSDGKFTKNGDDYVIKDTYKALVVVEIKAVAITEIKLDKDKATLKAGGTTTIKATLSPSEASQRTVKWCVAKNYANDVYEDYTKALDPTDLYNTESPIVIVSDSGKVTALRDGTCYVYAKIEQGGATLTSKPCKITVSKSDPTGVSLNKKKMTMSTGTFLTLTATVKPTAASNKGVSWSSNNPGVATVGATSGIIEAVAPGTAVITVTNSKNNKAECTITVTNAPSAVVRKGKSATYSVLGAPSSGTVGWTLSNEGDTPAFSGTESGSIKYKVTGNDVGSSSLLGIQTATGYNIDGTVNTSQTYEIRKQSWNLASVVAISKLQLTDESGDVVKKLTLCVDTKDKTRNETFTLSADLLSPSDATLLDFEWSSKKTDVATVEVVPGSQNNATVKISAVGMGSTKITALNYNGKKKISITVKVMLFPTSITPRATAVNLYVGKSTGVKGKVQGRGMFKQLEYSLTDKAGNPLENDNAIATLDPVKGKIYANDVGDVVLIIRGAPYDDKAAKVKVNIKITEKPTKK